MNPSAPPLLSDPRRKRAPSSFESKWTVEGDDLRVWQFSTLPQVDLRNGVVESSMAEGGLTLEPGFRLQNKLFAAGFLLSIVVPQAAPQNTTWVVVLSLVGLAVALLGAFWPPREALSIRVSESGATVRRRKLQHRWALGLFWTLIVSSHLLTTAVPRDGAWQSAVGILALIFWLSMRDRRFRCRRAGKDEATGRAQFLITGIHPDALRYLATHEMAQERVAESSAFGS